MKMKELFAEHGKWTRGHRRVKNDDGSMAFCLLGGMDECYPLHQDRWRVNKRVRCAIEALGWTANTDLGIACWNDAKGRTREEVLAICEHLDI